MVHIIDHWSGLNILGVIFCVVSKTPYIYSPCGALKLNNLGSISSILNPDTGHANFDENMDILFVSRFSKYNKPSDSVNATSILSLNLCWIFFLQQVDQ